MTIGNAPEEVRRIRRSRAALFVLFLLWPIALVDVSGPSMADSTLLAAIRLVDAGTWTLTDQADPETVFRTTAFDISTHDGRIYSGVGPGASVIAALWYVALKPAFALFGDDVVRNDRVLTYYLPNARALGVEPPGHFKKMYLLQIALVWSLMAPLFAWYLVRLHAHLGARGVPPAQATLTVVALGFGTMLLYYSSMYSRQGLAALLAWHALLSLLGITGGGGIKLRGGGAELGAGVAVDGESHVHRGEGIAGARVDGSAGAAPRGMTLVIAGTLCGAAVAIDYPLVILVGISLLFLLPRLDGPGRLRVVLPAAVVLLLTGLYHQSAFGSFFSTPYHHRFWFTHDLLAGMGVDLSAFQEGPLLGIGLPSPAVILQLCFGLYKGLFVYSPILLVALVGHFEALRLRRTSGQAQGRVRRDDVGAESGDLPDQRSAGAAVLTGSIGAPRSRGDARLHVMSLVIFGAYLLFNASLGSGLGEHAHHYWGGLSGLWGPRYLLVTLPFLALGLAGLDWSRRAVRLACFIALALSCVFNILGAIFARSLMSSFAFGSELRFPPGHVLQLLFTEGPRITILDAYGAPLPTQVLLLVTLLTVSAFLLRTSLKPPMN